MSHRHESKRARLQNGRRAEPVEIWKARKFIEEHSSEELSLTKVAQAVNISGNYLSEKFKDVTGLNFVEYVARVRFEKACDLLENVDRRISEIAFSVAAFRFAMISFSRTYGSTGCSEPAMAPPEP